MKNYYAFCQNHKYLKWMDYQLTRLELAEADEACRRNWIEIQQLYARIHILRTTLRYAGINVPDDFI